jgi:hypothetical protein
MDTLGEEHDIELKVAQKRICKENCETRNLEKNITDGLQVDQSVESSQIKENMANDKLTEYKATCHPGFSIVFDNIDLEIRRKDMTMANQNQDVHWVNHKMVQNRVSGNQLPWQGPKQELMDVPNIKFLPNMQDHKKQRHNYIVLVSRILVSYFDCFEPLKDSCIQHIPHNYTKEMNQKSEKVYIKDKFYSVLFMHLLKK